MTELVVLDASSDRVGEAARGHSTSLSAKLKLALNPKHPERICWGCDKYCPADDLRCGNGTIRTQHPVELFGEDWVEWELSEAASELTQCHRQE